MVTTLFIAITVFCVKTVAGEPTEYCFDYMFGGRPYSCDDGLHCCAYNSCCEGTSSKDVFLISPKYVCLVVIIVLSCITVTAFLLVLRYLFSLCRRSTDFGYQALPGEVVTSARDKMGNRHRYRNSIYPSVNYSYQN